MTDKVTDEMLMLGYRDGEAAAFNVLYHRHRGGLYRYLLRQANDRALAEEMFQDVWLKIIAARAGYMVTAKFSTYLYHVAHNRLIDHYRHTSRHAVLCYEDDTDAELEMLPACPDDLPEYQLERKQLAERLASALAALPEPQREAFVLHEESGLKLAEIAEVTGTTTETVKSRLRYALAKLRAGLRGLP